MHIMIVCCRPVVVLLMQDEASFFRGPLD
jgi:hypothetical protein